MFLSDDEAQAAGEVARATGKAIDLVRGVGGYLADTLGNIPRDLIGIAGGDWLHEQKRRNLERMAAKTARMLDDVDKDRISEPSASVVIPLLTAAADEAREELQNLWAALLANAMVDGGKRVRRSFFNIVAQFEPADALVMDARVRLGSSSGDTTIIRRNFLLDLERRGVSPEDVLVSFEALDGLGCVQGKDPPARLTVFGAALMRACAVVDV